MSNTNNADTLGTNNDPIAVTLDGFLGPVFAGCEGAVCLIEGGYAAQQWVKGNSYPHVTHFSISTIKPGDGLTLRRTRGNCVKTAVIVFDDVTTNSPTNGKAHIHPDKITVEPTYKMETSPGNFQYGYRLRPHAEPEKAAALIRALANAGFTDTGSKGANHVFRVPGSLKPGKTFPARLTLWEPERAWTLDELAAEFGIDMAAANASEADAMKAALARRSDPTAPTKPEFLALEAAGMILGRAGSQTDPELGRAWLIECPGTYLGEDQGGWIGSTDGHTPGGDNEAKVWENGGFKCHHGHCQGKTFNDLAMWVKTHPVAGPELRRITATSVFTKIEGDAGIAGGGVVGDSAAGSDEGSSTPSNSKGLPVIRVNKGSLGSRVKQTLAALAQRGDVYQRGGAPAMVKRTPVRGARGKRHNVSIIPLDAAGLLSVMSDGAMWGRDKTDKQGKPVFEPCDPPPMNIALAIMSAAMDLHPLPALSGVIRSPFLRHDGTVAQADGAPHYDVESELYVDPDGVQYPEVKDAECTRADALRALATLRAPIGEYKFDGEASAAVAVAALLMPFVRPAVDLVPGIAIDAPRPGSGKSMLASLPGILATGEVPAATPQTRTEEELDKQFSTSLLSGNSIVFLDNLEGSRWGTPLICSALTAHTLKLRLLGKSVERDIPNTSSLIVTGNNLAFPSDTPRRFLVCRINPGTENPEASRFQRHPITDVMRDRAKLAHAAMTILRGYVVAGAPDQGGQAMGSFEQYTGIVRDALMWLGLPDIATSTAMASAAVSADPELAAVLKAWKAWDDTNPFDELTPTAGDLIDAANQIDSTTGQDLNPGLRTALAAVCPKGLTAQTLGMWLHKYRDRFTGGACFSIAKRDRYKAVYWRLIPAGAPVVSAGAAEGFAPLD